MDENNRWVDEHLAKLNPEGDWEPQVATALARFEGRRAQRRYVGRWAGIASVAAVGAICLITFPQPRAFAARMIEPTVEAGGNFFNPVEVHQHIFQLMWTFHHWMGFLPPNIDLTDADGSNFRLSDYHGKTVLLNFLSSRCVACQEEIPWLVESERTHGNQRFAAIGVFTDEDGWKAVRPVIASMKINYRVAMIGDESMVADFSGVDSLPQTLLLDGNGRIVAKHVGIMSKGQYESEFVQRLESRRTEVDRSRAQSH
jgi:thiol-disulfide isomerase/thioredoxin